MTSIIEGIEASAVILTIMFIAFACLLAIPKILTSKKGKHYIIYLWTERIPDYESGPYSSVDEAMREFAYLAQRGNRVLLYRRRWTLGIKKAIMDTLISPYDEMLKQRGAEKRNEIAEIQV
jgi:hypothetical protein